MTHKLLIGEDEPHLEEILKYVANKLGLEYFTASDGKSVLNVAREIKPTIMLLDIYMPEINGIEVCELLKNDPETSGIYIIMITASSKKEDEDDAWKAGADEFMKKPFSPKALCEKLSIIMNDQENKKLGDFIGNQV